MSERKGSLVKMKEMDEPLFDRRSQHRVLRAEDERHAASPGCERRHGQKVRKGTRGVLTGPSQQYREREEPSYKEAKAKGAGRMADETAVLKMFCESRMEGRVSTDTQQPKELSQRLMRLWRRRRVHCES